jgi:RNAse (barnase) inhibitor barstar
LGLQVKTYLVVELDSLDDLLIGIEQGTNISLVLDELDVSNNSSSSYFGLVEIILNLGTLGQTLVLSVDMLSSQLITLKGKI